MLYFSGVLTLSELLLQRHDGLSVINVHVLLLWDTSSVSMTISELG